LDIPFSIGCVVLKIEIINEKEITPDLDLKIREGLCRSFPQYADTFIKTRYWNGILPVSSIVLTSDDGSSTVIAHAGIIKREILIDGNDRLSIFGIQNVFIQPDFRGQGLLGQLMREILKAVESGGYDCGLLFCVPELEKVYSGFSWEKISNASISAVDNEGLVSPISAANIAMYYPLRIREFPEGDVNLQGYDW